MGRLWIDDDVVRVHAKHVKATALAVYLVLCSHANEKSETFIGVRKIAEFLNINKETVVNAIKKLVVYGLVVQLPRTKGQVYGLQVKSVRIGTLKVYGSSVHKEDAVKEVIKEEELLIRRQKAEEAKKRLREKMGWNRL